MPAIVALDQICGIQHVTLTESQFVVDAASLALADVPSGSGANFLY
jgi:hypothetical protein